MPQERNIDEVKKRKGVFTKPPKLQTSKEKQIVNLQEKQNNVSHEQQTMEKCVTNADTIKAETIWTLKFIKNGFSFRSNDE